MPLRDHTAGVRPASIPNIDGTEADTWQHVSEPVARIVERVMRAYEQNKRGQE